MKTKQNKTKQIKLKLKSSIVEVKYIFTLITNKHTLQII